VRASRPVATAGTPAPAPTAAGPAACIDIIRGPSKVTECF
jgi:hypothetical protein